MLRQLALGSSVLFVASSIHILVLSTVIMLLPVPETASGPTGVAAIMISFAAVLAGHTVQVWIWAFVLVWTEAVATLEKAIYFALVTSTTLGYGDVTLERNWRLFGAIAAVNGLLTFGLSTAFLVKMLSTIFA